MVLVADDFAGQALRLYQELSSTRVLFMASIRQHHYHRTARQNHHRQLPLGPGLGSVLVTTIGGYII